MLTDEELDRALDAAGRRFRAAYSDQADVSLQPQRRRPPAGYVVLAAAVVIALAVTLPVVWGTGRTRTGDAVSHAPALNGTWVLQSADGHSAASGYLTLTFINGRMAFEDGINTGGGPVTVTADQLIFGDIAQTAIGGTQPDPVREAVDRALTGTAFWSINGDHLTVTRGTDRLVYVSEPTLLQQLMSTTWTLSDFTSGGVRYSASGQITARFGRDRYRLQLVCAQEGASYTIDRDQLFLQSPTMIEDCSHPLYPAPLTRELNATVNFFSHKAAWSIADGELTLSVGTASLTFTAR